MERIYRITKPQSVQSDKSVDESGGKQIRFKSIGVYLRAKRLRFRISFLAAALLEMTTDAEREFLNSSCALAKSQLPSGHA
jgi:hypothetical protein